MISTNSDFQQVWLTLIRPHNHHHANARIDAVLLVSVAVAGIVMLIVDVGFVEI